MERRDWTLLLILAAIWGSSYLFIEIGLRGLSAADGRASLRIALGAASCVACRLASRRAGAGAAARSAC